MKKKKQPSIRFQTKRPSDAGYIHKRYGFKYSIPAYVLAGYTAASRIDSKKHDILDVGNNKNNINKYNNDNKNKRRRKSGISKTTTDN